MLKELLAPTITSKTITIRQDARSDLGEYSDMSGRLYPLIKILDVVLNKDDIEFFELSVGLYQFYPSVTIQIKDYNYRIREALKPKIDVMTLYIGTNRDEFFIKNDYLIETVSGQPGAEVFTISGTFYVPDLLKSSIRAFKNVSGIDVITQICKDCGLGLLINYKDSQDKQTYIQDNCSNLDMIEKCVNALYGGDDTSFVAFMDHWSYLNVIDLKSMFSDRSVAQVLNHPYTGNKLDVPEDVVLTNKYFSFEPFKVSYWSQNNFYTIKSKNIPNSIKLYNINDQDSSMNITNNQVWSLNEQLKGNDSSQVRSNDNTHIAYGKLKVLNKYNRSLYDQDQKLQLEMQNLSMILYPSMYVPVKIYDSLKRVIYNDQNQNTTSTQLQEESIQNASKDIQQSINEEYSGNYGIIDIKWKYYNDERMIQYVNCIRLDDAKIDMTTSEINQENKKKYEKYVTEAQLSNYDPQNNTADPITQQTQTNMSTFFEAITTNGLFKRLTEDQKQYFNTISSMYQNAGFDDLRWLAYTFATTYHETARTMEPIDEFGFGAGRAYGIPDEQTGKTYYGRGYVQLTWKDNYKKFSQILGVDLVKYPEKAKEPLLAAKIQMMGMTQGLYTGKALKDYFTTSKSDWIEARRIINAKDRAVLIAGIGVKFYDALKQANGTIS